VKDIADDMLVGVKLTDVATNVFSRPVSQHGEFSMVCPQDDSIGSKAVDSHRYMLEKAPELNDILSIGAMSSFMKSPFLKCHSSPLWRVLVPTAPRRHRH
jgi:hypothetical protein